MNKKKTFCESRSCVIPFGAALFFKSFLLLCMKMIYHVHRHSFTVIFGAILDLFNLAYAMSYAVSSFCFLNTQHEKESLHSEEKCNSKQKSSNFSTYNSASCQPYMPLKELMLNLITGEKHFCNIKLIEL